MTSKRFSIELSLAEWSVFVVAVFEAHMVFLGV